MKEVLEMFIKNLKVKLKILKDMNDASIKDIYRIEGKIQAYKNVLEILE